MNVYGWVLLAAFGVAAVVDWVAVARDRRETERLAKPAAIVLLIAFAWLLHADQTVPGRWLLLGLVLSLVGDILLLPRRPGPLDDAAFTLGLLAFLGAQLTYIAAVLTLPRESPVWAGVALSVVVVAAAVGGVLLPRAVHEPREWGPPTLYALALGLFAVLAWWSGHVTLALGASLFVVSDGLLAVDRFLRPVPHGRLLVMVTYHLAQLLIVLGVLRPDLVGG